MSNLRAKVGNRCPKDWLDNLRHKKKYCTRISNIPCPALDIILSSISCITENCVPRRFRLWDLLIVD